MKSFRSLNLGNWEASTYLWKLIWAKRTIGLSGLWLSPWWRRLASMTIGKNGSRAARPLCCIESLLMTLLESLSFLLGGSDKVTHLSLFLFLFCIEVSPVPLLMKKSWVISLGSRLDPKVLLFPTFYLPMIVISSPRSVWLILELLRIAFRILAMFMVKWSIMRNPNYSLAPIPLDPLKDLSKTSSRWSKPKF